MAALPARQRRIILPSMIDSLQVGGRPSLMSANGQRSARPAKRRLEEVDQRRGSMDENRVTRPAQLHR
jgi:hypothetical protein